MDGQQFVVNLTIPPEHGHKLFLGDVELPLPSRILAAFKFHRKALSEQRFRAGAIEASTTAVRLFEEDLQLTLLSVPQPDGSSQVVLSVGPAAPPKTDVDR